MSVSEPLSFQQLLPMKANSPNSSRLLTTLPMVVTTIDAMDKANNNHNRNIPRFVGPTDFLLLLSSESFFNTLKMVKFKYLAKFFVFYFESKFI